MSTSHRFNTCQLVLIETGQVGYNMKYEHKGVNFPIHVCLTNPRRIRIKKGIEPLDSILNWLLTQGEINLTLFTMLKNHQHGRISIERNTTPHPPTQREEIVNLTNEASSCPFRHAKKPVGYHVR